MNVNQIKKKFETGHENKNVKLSKISTALDQILKFGSKCHYDAHRKYVVIIGNITPKIEKYIENWKLISKIGIFKNYKPVFFSQTKSPRIRVVVEHTSANPLDTPHLGNIRNSVIGNWVACALKLFSQTEVITHYYVNDLGYSAASAAEYYLAHGAEKYSYPAAKNLTKKNGLGLKSALFLEPTGENSKLRNIANKIVDYQMQKIVTKLACLGIYFDRFIRQSNIYHAAKKILSWGLNTGIDNFKLFTKNSNGQIIDNITNTPMTRSDGSHLYILNDIAYYCIKNINYDFAYCILCEQHKAHGLKIRKICEAIFKNHPRYKKNMLSKSIYYRYILKEDQKMSKSNNNTVYVSDVLRARGSIPAQFILKYQMLLTNPDKMIKNTKLKNQDFEIIKKLYKNLNGVYPSVELGKDDTQHQVLDYMWFIEQYMFKNTRACVLKTIEILEKFKKLRNIGPGAKELIIKIKKLFK